MKVLWCMTSSMSLEPIYESLEYAMNILFTSVSSMNLEPIVSGLEKEVGKIWLCKFDKGKEEQHHYVGEVDHEILNSFRTHKPEVVIYSGPAEGKCRPLLPTFHEIRKSAKLVNLVCDGGCPNWHPLLELYNKEDCFDLTVNIDGNDNWPSKSTDLTMPGPIDPRYYNGRDVPKVIPFGFAGGLGGIERRQITERLQRTRQLNIPERSETWGTYQGYADFMLSCKAVLNMGRTGSGKAHHLKYRIIESGLAKCCVFEEVNQITKKYFTAGMDYIEYENIDHLERLLGAEMDLRPYAESLHKKVTTKYTTEIFWKCVFDALGQCTS